MFNFKKVTKFKGSKTIRAKMPSAWTLAPAVMVMLCGSLVLGNVWTDPYINLSQEAKDQGVTYLKGSLIDFTISVPEKGEAIQDKLDLGILNFEGGK